MKSFNFHHASSHRKNIALLTQIYEFVNWKAMSKCEKSGTYKKATFTVLGVINFSSHDSKEVLLDS